MVTPLARFLDRWTADRLPDTPGRWVIPGPARALTIARLSVVRRPLLAVTPTERDAEDLVDDLRLFIDDPLLLPAWETLPFEHVSPNVSTMAHRAEAIDALRAGLGVVVGSVRAVAQRASPSPSAPVVVRRGDTVELADLVDALAGLGYHRTDRVEARGEFAVRGGIVDVFGAHGDLPIRVDMWGDEVDELRRFNPSDQRSFEDAELVVAYPAREFRPDDDIRAAARRLLSSEPWAAATWDRVAEGVVFQGIESWMPWLAPEASILDGLSADVVLFEPHRAESRSGELVEEERSLAEALATTWGPDAPAAGDHPPLYLGLERVLRDATVLQAPAVPSGPGDVGIEVRGLDATAGDPESVAAALRRLTSRGFDVVVAMDGEAAAERVGRVLGENDFFLAGDEHLLSMGIHHGFVVPDLRLAVLGEREIAGRRRAHRRVGRRRAVTGDAYRDLEPGDHVVHHHHGIGRFEGLVQRSMAGVERDYLLISYQKGDKLYVPTDQLAAVRKYTGGEKPRLSRMGGTDWSETRSKVRKAVAIVAEEVVKLHRERAGVVGFRADPDDPWQQEFEASFPFEETPDQLTAITDVKTDMESEQVMDRLIFGDVGFGKTEVAMRAMFKTVRSGKQAALLVPTTLLAQQHHATMEDRFGPYPVRVESLSRFLTTAQQKAVIRGMADGSVDLVIGTHRLLSEDVEFKNLGLLVIDEEQRFGVAAKDRLKRLRTSVDVLTLTATPIPRTLEMALTGIREVSHIRTPPEDRHPILTYVGSYDSQAVSAAIRREMLREGQVFYVHNRIQSIDLAVARLRDLVPDARYAIAHGRMSEGQLEQVMFDFWNGDYDVLVATTIIESGLDLPQVNTLIVERADLLGLAQLYQLRGRVGRSSQRAYAYLFHPEEERLSEEAYRRLEAIGEYSDLGSGFQLAMRDLEIRGAGSILSEVQSGHIAAVGFDLYVELVADAVDELRGVEAPEEPADVRIDLPIDAHLPADYVPDMDSRLEAYRRLAAAQEPETIADVLREWGDRFGPLPPEAEGLITVAHLRVEARARGITEIVKARNEIRLAPVDLKQSEEVRLARLQPRSVVRNQTVYLPAPRTDPANTLLEFLRTMWPL
ncbi:MAG: transcription-repair coupling factor [Acidimicrobiia bacterium]|nr:transcription-repair coupling factor [Acidimicrobiia bacterium]NNF68194.1 transcription-repair coupling factor [Acidimicrobiia bacterium]